MGKTILTKEQEKIIIHNYVDLKMGQKNSGKQFGVGDKTVKKVLIEHGIHIRTASEARQKFNIKKNYFSIQSRNMAYILGMLASDGCVASKKNIIYIELQRGDREILEKINKELENDREVKDYCTSRGYENSKIYFYSKEAKDELATYNIISNKVYNPNYKFPTKLNKEFYWDFIRGLFDGDGCIKDSNHTPIWEINSTSQDMVLKIQKYLKEEGIETKIQTFEKNRNLPMYRIYCYSQEKCKKIFDKMYNDTDLFMLRKKNKFISLLK